MLITPALSRSPLEVSALCPQRREEEEEEEAGGSVRYPPVPSRPRRVVAAAQRPASSDMSRSQLSSLLRSSSLPLTVTERPAAPVTVTARSHRSPRSLGRSVGRPSPRRLPTPNTHHARMRPPRRRRRRGHRVRRPADVTDRPAASQRPPLAVGDVTCRRAANERPVTSSWVVAAGYGGVRRTDRRGPRN